MAAEDVDRLARFSPEELFGLMMCLQADYRRTEDEWYADEAAKVGAEIKRRLTS